ncbi:MAG TPA: DUF4192 family protein, partial [Actinotalea sp.]|nr:DUF4192 family protein [Actinotalea sp.]
MTTTIRTSEPAELLALVPFQLGFRPTESAVVVSLRRNQRVGLVARVDLGDLADRSTGPEVARGVVGHVLADGALSWVVVLFTAEDLQADPSAGRRVLAHLADAGEPHLGDPNCWVVGPDGYYGLECSIRSCCPAGGRPLTDLQSTRVGAEMVLLGSAVERERADLGRLPVVPAGDRRAARRAAQRWSARLAATDGPAQAHRWRRASLGLWRSLLDASPSARVPATDVGRLQAGLEDVLVRDAVLVDLVPGFSAVADRVAAGWDGPEVGEALRAIVDPRRAVPPPGDRVRGAERVLRQVAAHRPSGAVPALTLLAVLAWWQGDGARSAV